MGAAPERRSALRRLGRHRLARNALRGRKTTVKDRRKEIGAGLLGKMLADLGIERKEL